MKKKIYLLLVLMLFCGCFCSCTTQNSQTTSTQTTTQKVQLSRAEVLEMGKQDAVNHFCKKEKVNSIRVVYGTEDVTKEPDGDWKVHLLGYYYPVSAYGEIGDKEMLSYTVHYDENGKKLADFEY